MAFMHRVSGWLGRLSVGRKLMLIYLLDLSAVIYVSSILIHEKYVAIDFTRKEIVGTTYAAVLRDGLMGQFLDASQQPPLAGDVIARLTGVRKAYDEQLRTQEVGERFSMVLGQLAARPPSATDAQVLTGMRSQLLREGRELLTTQMYVKGEPMNARDFLFGRLDREERERVAVALAPADALESGALAGTFDIVVEP